MSMFIIDIQLIILRLLQLTKQTIDVLLYHETDVEIEEHFTDANGYSN